MYSGEAKDKLLDVMENGLKKEADTHEKFPDFRAGLLDSFYTLKVMHQAPVIIMVYNPYGGSPFEQVETDARISEICDTLSVGAAIENMLLKATEIRLGTLWIANTLFAYSFFCRNGTFCVPYCPPRRR